MLVVFGWKQLLLVDTYRLFSSSFTLFFIIIEVRRIRSYSLYMILFGEFFMVVKLKRLILFKFVGSIENLVDLGIA